MPRGPDVRFVRTANHVRAVRTVRTRSIPIKPIVRRGSRAQHCLRRKPLPQKPVQRNKSRNVSDITIFLKR